MSLEDWKQFISLIHDEHIILVNTNVVFYPKSVINYRTQRKCCLVLTNKRLFCISKAFKGIFTKRFIGYQKVEYQIHIDDIDILRIVDDFEPCIKISRKNRLYSKASDDVAINLGTKEILNDFYKKLSSLILLSKEPKTVKQEIVQYNISTKFEFGTDGGLLISCPFCGGSTQLESKTNPVRCPFCNKEYVVPKKLLDLI